MLDRIVEVFAGAYASGKSETAINRALQYVSSGKKITIADLDTVEPAYTLRPIAGKLQMLGVGVITQNEYFGLGEAGSYVTSEQINCLSVPGDVIIDVGYGAAGLDVLDIINNIEQEKNIRIYLVINTAKFETSTVENIIEYINFSKGVKKSEWKKFTGFISNTHLGDDTTEEDITKGYFLLKRVSELVNIPIRAIGIDEKLAKYFEKEFDGVEIWKYKRMMPFALW